MVDLATGALDTKATRGRRRELDALQRTAERPGHKKPGSFNLQF